MRRGGTPRVPLRFGAQAACQGGDCEKCSSAPGLGSLSAARAGTFLRAAGQDPVRGAGVAGAESRLQWRHAAIGIVATALAIAALLASTVARANDDRLKAADANGDGVLALEEAVAAIPATTGEEFNSADLDQNGSLNLFEPRSAGNPRDIRPRRRPRGEQGSQIPSRDRDALRDCGPSRYFTRPDSFSQRAIPWMLRSRQVS